MLATLRNSSMTCTIAEASSPSQRSCLRHLLQHGSLPKATSHWGYGATAARLTPDQKVGSSNLSGLIEFENRSPEQHKEAPNTPTRITEAGQTTNENTETTNAGAVANSENTKTPRRNTRKHPRKHTPETGVFVCVLITNETRNDAPTSNYLFPRAA